MFTRRGRRETAPIRSHQKVFLRKIQNPKLKSAMQKADEEERKNQDRKLPSAKIQTRK